MARPSSLSVSSSAPTIIANENLISPSKMKQRTRRAKGMKSPSSSASSSMPIIRPSPRDSRDDGPGSPRGPGTPRSSRSRRQSASSKRTLEDPASPSTRSRGETPGTPRSNASALLPPRSSPRTSSRRSSKENLQLDNFRDDGRRGDVAVTVPRNVDTAKRPDEIDPASKTDPQAEDESQESPRTRLQRKLLSSLREPDQSLSDLLAVITDEKTSHLRRVNACGAIKTLTLHARNQIPLARTRGVVPSLTTVLCAVNATEEERTRCVNALMHLCVPEENWKLVYLFPQAPEALARNMADSAYPQIRYAACLATSFLAKKNRRDIVKNRLIMYAMARVLEVNKSGALDRMSEQDRKVYVGARLCVLKMLLHLSKNKDVSSQLARTASVVSALVLIAGKMETPANIICIAVLTNLTRLPDNAYHLAYKCPDLVNTMVEHIESDENECAKCALYSLQNLSCTGNCRQELANTPDLLSSVTKAAFRHDFPEQQISALHTLKNLSDDPFNLVTMTNTPGCTATLLALANDSTRGGVAQYVACDTLATLSHWLLTLSSTRKTVTSKGEDGENVDVGRRTFKQNTYESWQ